MPYPSSVAPVFVTRRTACLTVTVLLFLILSAWCVAGLLIVPVSLNRVSINALQEENSDLRSDLDATTELVGQLVDAMNVLDDKVEELFHIDRNRCIDDYMDIHIPEHPELLGDGSAANVTAAATALLPAAEEACIRTHYLI